MEIHRMASGAHVGLRRGIPSDIPFIYRLEKRYIEEIENDHLARWQDSIEQHLKQWLNSLPHTTIAHLRDIPVGYLFWEQEGEKAVIASVNVDPSFRRRGVGLALLKSFEDEARLTGCSVAELGFVIHNPARHLYERCGYQTAGVEGRYLLMTKRL